MIVILVYILKKTISMLHFEKCMYKDFNRHRGYRYWDIV